MKLKFPFSDVHLSPSLGQPYERYISQVFGNDPVASVDTYYGTFLVKAGQHVYQVLAGQKGHNGVDIAAPLGTPISGCVLEGEAYIIYQSHDAGYGNTTCVRVIDNDKNYVLLFGHQQKFEPDIEVIWNWNDKTRPFELNKVCGYVNSTGASTGNHCHWGCYEYDSLGNKLNSNNGFGGAIDAMQFLGENVMSNAIFVHNVNNPNEFGIYLPALSPEALRDKALNFGLEIQNPDGTLKYLTAKEMTLVDPK